MTDVINIRQTLPKLDQISTIKWLLPIKSNKIVIIGYNKQSITNMQYIYQVFDFTQSTTLTKGRIKHFAIIFLSEYIPYKESGQFLILCESMGTRKIILQNFVHGVTTTLVKEIYKHQFQQNSKKETSCLHYSERHDKTYLLQISQFSKDQVSLFFRVYRQDMQIASYRIICLENEILPRVIFSPQHILCIYQQQFILYKQTFDHIDFHIQNMQQFKILTFYHSILILQFKQNKSIFTMSINGALKPLLQQYVMSYHVNQKCIWFLYLKEGKYYVIGYEERYGNMVIKEEKAAGVEKSKSKSNGYRIVNSNQFQVIINDVETG